MKIVRTVRYFLIELLYTGIMLYFFNYMQMTYSVDTVFDHSLFMIICLGLIALIWFIGPMLNRYFVLVYGAVYFLYLVSQDVYKRAFHQYYRFSTVQDLFGDAFAARASAMEFIAWEDLYPFLALLGITLVFVILYFLLQRRCVKLLYRLPLKLAVLLLFYPGRDFYYQYLDQIEGTKNSEDAFQINKTDYYVYEVIPSTNQFVDKFGLLTFAYRDAETFLTAEVLSEEDRQEIAAYMNARPAHKPNDMTGLLAGKNIIFIQAESFINAACTKELTPTIWQMQQNSIRIENFNTPALPGSTSDTEFMANTSLIPNSEGHAVCYKYPYNTYVTTLPKLFHKHGYYTYAFHNNYRQYYNRSLTMPGFGYDEFLDCTDLRLPDSQPDTTVMEIMKWIFTDEDKPYLAYWITFSGHQPYDLDSFGVSEEDVARIRKLYPDLEDPYVSFLAKNMDLDRSLTTLMEELRNAGKLDDVVFVFFGDHIVKGLDYSSTAPFYKETDQAWSPEKAYTDLYIYNTATKPMTYTKVATALDLLPTIANLWGFKFDNRTILGTDIFDPDYKGFYFSEWEFWKTDNYAYDFMYDDFYDYGNYSLVKAEEEMQAAMYKRDIARKILKLDYFAEKNDH